MARPTQIVGHIDDKPLDIGALRRAVPALPDCGGYVCFEGIIRNVNHGRQVTRLEYEVYETLARKELLRIAEAAVAEFDLQYISCVHRSGTVEVGEAAVVIQVLSRHRGAAFQGCRYAIDHIKKRVPIWKKEHYADGTSEWTQCHDSEHVLDPTP